MTGSRFTIGLEVAKTVEGPAALPPGDYSVRAVIGLVGRPLARIFRTLHEAGR